MNTTVFITGTSTGIGNSIAKALLEDENTSVVGIGRRNTIDHPSYTHIQTDLSDPAETEKINFKDYLNGKEKNLTLVNNAGVIEPIRYIGEADDKAIVSHLNVNLVSPALLTNRFINQCRDAGATEKLIVNVSSGAATSPYDGWACYCSSKAGLEMFARVVDQEQKLKGSGFIIFSIAPGIIDTPMQETIRSADERSFSNKDKFIKFKKESLLKDADKIGENFAYIIRNPNEYNKVCFQL